MNISEIKQKITEANQLAMQRMLAAQPVWIDVCQAGEVIPGMKKNLLLHAGPPQVYQNMCGPQRGSAWGSLLYEGLAKSRSEAEHLLETGEVEIAPAHDYNAVAGAGHTISYHQPVIVVENLTNGQRYYAHMKEDTFVALRYGSYSPDTIDKLKWMTETIAPLLGKAIRASGGININEIISKSLFMGDEGHNRNQAQTCLFEQKLMPILLDLDISTKQALEIARLLQHDENFFLYPVMAASKAMGDAARDVAYSTLVFVMARNGTEFGIKASGLGNKWFTCPAPMVKGLYFPGFTETDANPDLGDSCITEVAGIGGFVMAASPAIVHFGTATGIGGSVQDAIRYTEEMYEITLKNNPAFQIAYLDFRGAPTGIDLLKVLQSGIQPIINTSISPKVPGRSQAGAGLVRAPIDCFKKAFQVYASEYGLS
ncbi:MAG: YlbE family protein [Anaerolineaceae bacterium]